MNSYNKSILSICLLFLFIQSGYSNILGAEGQQFDATTDYNSANYKGWWVVYCTRDVDSKIVLDIYEHQGASASNTFNIVAQNSDIHTDYQINTSTSITAQCISGTQTDSLAINSGHSGVYFKIYDYSLNVKAVGSEKSVVYNIPLQQWDPIEADVINLGEYAGINTSGQLTTNGVDVAAAKKFWSPSKQIWGVGLNGVDRLDVWFNQKVGDIIMRSAYCHSSCDSACNDYYDCAASGGTPPTIYFRG